VEKFLIKIIVMKRIVLLFVATTFCINLYAQEKEVIFSSSDRATDEEKGGFRKDMLFTGGNLNLFFGSVTVLGATPHLGYNVTQWLDAGVSFGYTWSSQHDDAGNRYRQSLIAPGAFVRLFPVDFLYATAHFEHNFIKTKALYVGGYEAKESVSAASLLVGLGYTSGREGRNSPYYYFSISIDVLSNPNSPYRDVVFTQDGSSPNGYRIALNDPYPVVRAGFNIPLFQGSRRR
jgi:hypothetical protein